MSTAVAEKASKRAKASTETKEGMAELSAVIEDVGSALRRFKSAQRKLGPGVSGEFEQIEQAFIGLMTELADCQQAHTLWNAGILMW